MTIFMEQDYPRLPRWRHWPLTLAVLAIMGLTARLGFWQLDRAHEKEVYSATLAQRQQMPRLSNADVATTAAKALEQQHRAVTLKGRWLQGSTVLLDNRQMDARPGFFVVAALQLSEGDAVIVQRGWVPRDQAQRTRVNPPPLSMDAEVTVQGRLALPPSRLFEFQGQEQGLIRQNLDPLGYARELRVPLRPVSVLQLGEEPGLLRQWLVPASSVRKHHGYAFQWFALCALTGVLYVWFEFIQPFRRR
jgi:surfeit locus 1 family protein